MAEVGRLQRRRHGNGRQRRRCVAGAPTLVSAPVISGPAGVGETLGALAPVIAGHGATGRHRARVVHLPRRRGRRLHRCGRRCDASGRGGGIAACGCASVPRRRARPSLVTWSAPTEPVLGRNHGAPRLDHRLRPGASWRVTLVASLDRPRVVSGGAVVLRGPVSVTGDVPRPIASTSSGPVARSVSRGRRRRIRTDLRARVSERVVLANVAGRGDALRAQRARCASRRASPRASPVPGARRRRHGARPARHRRCGRRVPVSRFRLLLEGRAPQGVVGLICRVDEQPVVLEGRLRRALPLAPAAAPLPGVGSCPAPARRSMLRRQAGGAQPCAASRRTRPSGAARLLPAPRAPRSL